MKKILYFVLTGLIITSLSGCAKQPLPAAVDSVSETGSAEAVQPSFPTDETAEPELPTEEVVAIPPSDETNIVTPAQKAGAPVVIIDTKTATIVEPGVVVVDDRVELPASLNLLVPFISQAPTGDWGLPYQELCEEAAVLSAEKYFLGESKVSESTANTELLKLLAWESQNLGTSTDITLAESKRLAEEYLHLKTKISDDYSIANIKRNLANGNVVIVPTAGRELNGPFYSGAGPIYHFLVIRGYEGSYFITNDPGTRTKGNGFKFKQSVILNAIHDLPLIDGKPVRIYDSNLPDAEKEALILTGAKRILIVTGLDTNK